MKTFLKYPKLFIRLYLKKLLFTIKFYFIKKRRYFSIPIFHHFRIFMMKILFNEDERFLLIRAIDDRVENLERSTIEDKSVDAFNIKTDINDLKKLRRYFWNDLWD